jgi:hypothetical protein
MRGESKGKTFLLPLAFLSLWTTGQREVACLREAASAKAGKGFLKTILNR